MKRICVIAALLAIFSNMWLCDAANVGERPSDSVSTESMSKEEKLRIARERSRRNFTKVLNRVTSENAQRKPTVKSFNITIEHDQYKGKQLGAYVHYKCVVENADKLGIDVRGQSAMLAAVMKPDASVIYDVVWVVVPSMDRTTGVYTGKGFIPYSKIKYQRGHNEFHLMVGISDMDGNSIGESNKISFARYYYK